MLTPMARILPAAWYCSLQRAPRAVNVAVGLMNEDEVDVIKVEPRERTFKRGSRRRFTGVFQPDFGGDEKFLAGNAASLYAAADFAFIHIRLRGVDVAVAGADGINNRLLGLRRRDLIHAKAQHGDFDAIDEGEGLYGCSIVG